MNTISKIAVGLLSLGYVNMIAPLNVTIIKMPDPQDTWSYVVETFQASDATKSTKKKFDKKTSTTIKIDPAKLSSITIIKQDGTQLPLPLTSDDRLKLARGEVIVITPDMSYQMLPKDKAAKGTLLKNRNSNATRVNALQGGTVYLSIDVPGQKTVYLPVPSDVFTLDVFNALSTIVTDNIKKSEGLSIKGRGVIYGK